MSKGENIASLVRKNILRMKPYSSARDEYSGSASVFLDANENPYNTPLNRYPDPRQQELKRRIAGLRGMSEEELFLGNGSDEGIDLLFRVCCEPGRDRVLTVDPTYGMYGVCAEINGVERQSVLLNRDFSLDPDAVLSAVDESTKLIFLCSPNNPTSNSLDRDSILKILDGVNCLVVVDEAYIDFSRNQSLLPLVKEKWNLVILQTLSKAWGLAGIRLGMLFAQAELVYYITKAKYPYNVNSLTIQAALKALEDKVQSRNWIREILHQRKLLEDQLRALPFVRKVYPSDANFLLVRVDDPGRIYAYLMQEGIIVRNRSSVPLCEGCLRISIGTPEENRALINALKKIES
jgi:histidinol-phosphate aminotransferase